MVLSGCDRGRDHRKKEYRTRITDAPFVIGTGPGFTAGIDCNCVVETKRGHTLGNIIWKGSAIPNTGVPGNVGGYTIERLIRASGDGRIEPEVQIGDSVGNGAARGGYGRKSVYAQMSGIVRGMLQEGARVKTGLKIGDIDARAEISNCYTISDKARAIGGGVLEAVTGYERMKGRYASVILAAGAGTRFGGDKLSAPVRNKPLYLHTVERMQSFGFPVFFVTGNEEIAGKCGRGLYPVRNTEPEKGISRSLRLGLKKALDDNPDLEGVLFLGL